MSPSSFLYDFLERVQPQSLLSAGDRARGFPKFCLKMRPALHLS